MLNLGKVGLMLGVGMLLSACSSMFGGGNNVDSDYDVWGASLKADEEVYQTSLGDNIQFSGRVSEENTDLVYAEVNAGGVAYCPPQKRCLSQILPPQPCRQPIPPYYGNATSQQLENAVVLIHPYTRAQAVCPAGVSEGAVACANTFRQKGYVLITDLPQQPAEYDYLKKGTYPTRKWRNGETVPRW